VARPVRQGWESITTLGNNADGTKGLVGVVAEGGDGGDAHHDDQGQHDGVLDRGRAVFALQEVDDGLQHDSASQG